ncbi:MAG: hypothetical protein QOE22_337 [Candidatus Parcubacteria bacterium]|nr:hypothetical protein [Candidatus Parcubacteria bacterium]
MPRKYFFQLFAIFIRSTFLSASNPTFTKLKIKVTSNSIPVYLAGNGTEIAASEVVYARRMPKYPGASEGLRPLLF